MYLIDYQLYHKSVDMCQFNTYFVDLPSKIYFRLRRTIFRIYSFRTRNYVEYSLSELPCGFLHYCYSSSVTYFHENISNYKRTVNVFHVHMPQSHTRNIHTV